MRLFDAPRRLHDLILGFLTALAHYSIRYPQRVIITVVGATLVAAPGITWLKLRTDGHALLSPDAPEVIYDHAIREQFGIEDPIVVIIRAAHPDGVFNFGTVQLVRDLTAAFAKLPGINPANVMSLATEPGLQARPGTFIPQPLLERALNTKPELENLREEVRRIKLYTGTFVSADGKSAAILIGSPSVGDRTLLYQKVLDIIAARQPMPEEISVTGAPVAESLLGIHILEDLGVPKRWLGNGTRTRAEKLSMPANLSELRLLVARRIGLVPIAILVMMLIFLLIFRSIPAMLLPVPGVVATMIFVFGLMGWLGVPIYLTIAVMPVLLAATGITNDIYLFNRYFALLQEGSGRSHVALIGETFDKLIRPIAATSLTTAIGFFSFGFSPLGPVRAFGIFGGVGVLFGLFASLTLLPAMLALIKPDWLLPSHRLWRKVNAVGVAAWFADSGPWIVRWRWRWMGLGFLVIALTPLGLRRLTVQDSWTQGFDPNSEFRRATLRVNEDFHGMHLLLVALDAPQTLTGEVPFTALSPVSITLPGETVADPVVLEGSPITISVAGRAGVGAATSSAPNLIWHSHLDLVARHGDSMLARVAPEASPPNFSEEWHKAGLARFEVGVRTHLKPEVIQLTANLASFIRERRRYAVGGVISPADYLATTRFMIRPNDREPRRLGDTAAEIKLLWDYYGLARGPERLRQVVDTNYYWRSLTTVFLKDANFVDTAKLMSDIREFEREHLTPKGIKLGFAGDVAVSQSLIRGIVTTQLQSLIWSLLGIFVVTAFFGRSLRWGFYCLLPSLLAIVIKFAVMGWADIPLGVATSMFAAMTLGIGVNCAIHLLEACHQARAAGVPPAEVVSHALRLTGPPALINTLAMSLGFGVLMLSQVPANARLGILLVLGLVNCLVASLLILPVLLHWWPLKKTVVTSA